MIQWLKKIFNKIHRHAEQGERRLCLLTKQQLWQRFLLTALTENAENRSMFFDMVNERITDLEKKIQAVEEDLFMSYRILYRKGW